MVQYFELKCHPVACTFTCLFVHCLMFICPLIFLLISFFISFYYLIICMLFSIFFYGWNCSHLSTVLHVLVFYSSLLVFTLCILKGKLANFLFPWMICFVNCTDYWLTENTLVYSLVFFSSADFSNCLVYCTPPSHFFSDSSSGHVDQSAVLPKMALYNADYCNRRHWGVNSTPLCLRLQWRRKQLTRLMTT